ncbi:HD domain-containing protein [Streptomyces aureocirculatus]|uniref:HD domain-containing protein n=1 Tax=Streptomyces aureocirculatus TaxID=67275 RepID=UPI0004CC7CE0|nr:caspase family protein [Streptomyces aureocirculatus]
MTTRGRCALLIGIGHVPAAAGLFEPLDDAVDADLRLMNSALGAAGYDVTTLHNAGLNEIRTRIHEAARDVPEGGTLLLYFTGHGIRAGGIDYLVPFDAFPPADGDWQEPYIDSLLPASISPWLKASTAGTVVWAVDACRTELAADDVPFGNSVDNGPPGGGFAVLMGCSAGERAGSTGEGSFFTRGLAEALSPLTPARAVEDVFDAAAARTKAVAHRHGRAQNAFIHYGTNFEARTRSTDICEGRPLLEAWQGAVRDTSLWQLVDDRGQGCVVRFKDCLSAFVERCAFTLHRAQERLPHEDPWSDDTFPVRLLCDRLPSLLPAGATLSAVEVATLVAAPFLREAAWAERLSQAAEIAPESLGRRPGADAYRRHYEQIAEQHVRVARKATECRARERTEDAVAVTMWLVHRWVADRFETDDEAVPSATADELAAGLLQNAGAVPDRVQELSGLLRAAAAGIGLDEPPEDLAGRAPAKVLLPGGHQPLRLRPLAALLRLAGALAVDVRTFPEVVAEHLAVSDPVLPQEVVGLVSQPELLSWQSEGSALHLDVPCPHQAVHAALIDVAHQADQLAGQVASLAATLPAPEATLLAAVPTRITDRDLRPSRSRDRTSYEVPLLRFHLAQTEVRELLMGEQLYGGEPQLALRELYQNAMDACRYRAMRWRYLGSVGASPAPWTGRISLVQGEDDRGRYVECRDNGVGMSADQLKYTFTRAGSRFEQSKAFRREQSRWLRHDPGLRLYPNSRFGIGVFSYFMLADEMSIVTRQVSAEGNPAEHALRVDIPSSGSLFRIKWHEGPGDSLPEGGTRVRLYLRPGHATDGLSCVGTLRDLVRVSEFDLEVRDAAGTGHTWERGVLQPGVGGGSMKPLEAVPGVLWWVGEDGGVLCDGITTDVRPFGYVLNLTGPHAGQLNVSRKELQDYDRDWELRNWRAGARKLSEWPQLRMEWLWDLEQRNLPVARALWREWRGTGVTATRADGHRHSLDVQGWFWLDRAIASQRGQHPGDGIHPWRAAALRVSHAAVKGSTPKSLVGYPVPEPGDAAVQETDIIWWNVLLRAAEQETTVTDVLRRKRRLRIAHSHEAPPAVHGEGFDEKPGRIDMGLAETLSGSFTADLPTNVRHNGAVTRETGCLVLTSQKLAEPLGRVVARYERWAHFHHAPPLSVPAHHHDHVCTESDIAHLFLDDTTTYERSLVPVSGARQVREVCRRTGTSTPDVLRLLDEFSWLGWSAPAAGTVQAWIDPDEETDKVLARFADAEQEPGTLCWAATISVAARRQCDLATAEEDLARVAAATGLTFERRYAGDGRGGPFVPSPDTGTFVDTLNNNGVLLERGVNLEELGRASRRLSDAAEITGVVEDLRAAKVAVPTDVRAIIAWPALPLRSRYALSGKEAASDDEDYPADRLTASGLLYTAECLHESLGEVWSLARQEADRFGLTVPPLPEELTTWRPSSHMNRLLINQPLHHGQFHPATWKPLILSSFAQYARDHQIGTATAYARMSVLRPIGALVPPLSPRERDALPMTVPSARDVVALSRDQWVSREGELCALDLVSIAGRLGEPVPDTLRRIAPYLPMLPAPVQLPPPPDTIPLWQDLAILSEHLDGRLPALTGRVSARHIARAADAVDEPEPWVTARLREYATFFSLDLDDAP